MKNILIKEGFITNNTDKVFLTKFISDNDTWYGNSHEYVEIDGKKQYKLKDNVKEYHDGGHGYPYVEDAYDEIADDVWLLKGD